MRPFHFIADCVFEAENIDDAFRQLEDHFGDLRKVGESKLSCVGRIAIKLVKPKNISQVSIGGTK